MAMRPLWIVLAAALAGCSTLMLDPLEQLRDANKQNIAKLSVGHTRLEVESIMGNARAGGGLPELVFGRVQYLQARNPMREERLVGVDGVEYEVLFYYTDLRERDDKITDDELTPVGLREGKVAGVGDRFLGERVPKYRAYQ
jgi:hypothetical protein